MVSRSKLTFDEQMVICGDIENKLSEIERRNRSPWRHRYSQFYIRTLKSAERILAQEVYKIKNLKKFDSRKMVAIYCECGVEWHAEMKVPWDGKGKWKPEYDIISGKSYQEKDAFVKKHGNHHWVEKGHL